MLGWYPLFASMISISWMHYGTWTSQNPSPSNWMHVECFYKLLHWPKSQTTLATKLLPQAMQATMQRTPSGMNDISQSVLEWPVIHYPLAPSWCLWKHTICLLFTGMDWGTCLCQPLRTWNIEYNTNRFSKWQLSTMGCLMHKKELTSQPWIAIPINAMQWQSTFSATIPMNQPFLRPLVTLYNTYHHSLSSQSLHWLRQWEQFTSLIQQFCITLQLWQQPLFGPAICQLQPPSQLKYLCQTQHSLVSIVTDASVQKNYQSGFAWVIAHNAQKLWHGVRLTLGCMEDIYSGQAEAFGMLAALTFLQHYVASYGPPALANTLIKCFCDNLGIITMINKMMHLSIIQPNGTRNNDRDVYLMLTNVIKHCGPLQLIFLHIKGHQDKQPNLPLTIIEQLNVECDRDMKHYIILMPTRLSTSFGIPTIPAAELHLWIKGKIICCKLMPTLQLTLSAPDYCNYLKKKLNWTHADLVMVPWEVLHLSLHSFDQKDQCRLILFINDKLPLWASKAHPIQVHCYAPPVNGKKKTCGISWSDSNRNKNPSSTNLN